MWNTIPQERIHMRIFPNFPKGAKVCPICKTDADLPTVLVIIDGTEEVNENGQGVAQAAPTHVHCIEIRWRTDRNMMYVATAVEGGEEYVSRKKDSNVVGRDDSVPDAKPGQEDSNRVDVRKEGQGEDGAAGPDHKSGVSDS